MILRPTRTGYARTTIRGLQKVVGKLARDLADETLQHLDQHKRTDRKYELIAECFERFETAYRQAVRSNAMREKEVIPAFLKSVTFAGKPFERGTLRNALKFVKEKREAEEAHTKAIIAKHGPPNRPLK